METKYKLIRQEEIRDSGGELYDWAFTVIAESKTRAGVIQYAKMKKLSPDDHFIEKMVKENISGIIVWSITDDAPEYLCELLK